MMRILILVSILFISCDKQVQREMSVTSNTPTEFEVTMNNSSPQTLITPYHLELEDEKLELYFKSLDSTAQLSVKIFQNGDEVLVSNGKTIELLIDGSYMSTTPR